METSVGGYAGREYSSEQQNTSDYCYCKKRLFDFNLSKINWKQREKCRPDVSSTWIGEASFRAVSVLHKILQLSLSRIRTSIHFLIVEETQLRNLLYLRYKS